jgi:hypothetical protein
LRAVAELATLAARVFAVIDLFDCSGEAMLGGL